MIGIGFHRQFSDTVVRDVTRFRFSFLQAFENLFRLFLAGACEMNTQNLRPNQPLAQSVVLKARGNRGCECRAIDHRQPRQLQHRETSFLIPLRVTGNERDIALTFFHRFVLRCAELARHPLIGDLDPEHITKLQPGLQYVEHMVATDVIVPAAIVQDRCVDNRLPRICAIELIGSRETSRSVTPLVGEANDTIGFPCATNAYGEI